MNDALARVAATATRLKNPLGIAGLALVILYGVLSQILEMNVFSNLGSENTLTFLTNIVDKLFYIAIGSLALGTIAFLFSKFWDRPRLLAPSVSMIDAGLGSGEKNYEQVKKPDGTTVISPKKEE